MTPDLPRDDSERLLDDFGLKPRPRASKPQAGGSQRQKHAKGLQGDSVDPLIGADLGGFHIVRLIAEGGMGRVYEGVQEKPRRPVAIKVMRPGCLSSDAARRFENEWEVLGSLRHPNIAQIFFASTCSVLGTRVPYFVMEFIPDALPITKFAASRRLSTSQRLRLFRKVCEAVAHGHKQGILHRDLKPSNILVEPSGNPKIIDFGVARNVNADPAHVTQLTNMGQLIGTVQYMSPEQFTADPSAIDLRSDVYALGVILYELLAGKPPYELSQKHIFDAAQVVREFTPVSPAKLNRNVTDRMANVAGKCLEKDRSLRYDTAADLATAIARCLEANVAPPPEQQFGLEPRKPSESGIQKAFANFLSSVSIGTDRIADRVRRGMSPTPWLRVVSVLTCVAAALLAVSIIRDVAIPDKSPAAFSEVEGVTPSQRVVSDSEGPRVVVSSDEKNRNVRPTDTALTRAVDRDLGARAGTNGDRFGTRMEYQEDAWTGTWSRRGDSNVWDCKMSKPGGETVIHTAEINVEGNQARVNFTNGIHSDKGPSTAHQRLGTLSEDRRTIWFGEGGTGGRTHPGKDYFVRAAAKDPSSAIQAATEPEFSERAATADDIPRTYQPLLDSIEPTNLNDPRNWVISKGAWSFTKSGQLHGEGDSAILFRRTLSWPTELSFKMRVLSGMRPRVNLGGTGIYFGNEGYEPTIFLYGNVKDPTGSPFRYKPNTTYDVTVRASEKILRLLIDGKEVGTTALEKCPDSVSFVLSGGDGWSPGVTEFWDFKSKPSEITRVPVTVVNSIGMKLAHAPAGTFTVSDGLTQHKVTLTKPFYLGVHEVTNSQWQRVMGSVPSKWKDGDRPVEKVSWDDAVDFCQKLSALPAEKSGGRVYRLPTAAEWEYACRAGTTTAYSFGDDDSRLGDFAWFDGNSGEQTHPVGQKKPNAWGLYDMQGNVWEWCSDWYGEYPDGAEQDPQGPSGGSLRVNRGGSWNFSAMSCRSADRGRREPSYRDFNLGFRVARSLSESDPLKAGTPAEQRLKGSQTERATGLTEAGPASSAAASGSENLQVLTNSIGVKLKLLPHGTFTMGDATGQADETAHQVTLTNPFFLGVHEVTNTQWKRVMGSVPSKWKDGDRPVEQVSWEDAVNFCQKLSALPAEKSAGRVYRLPTEAEWEYACRAGTTTKYSFGDDESLLGDFAWCDWNSGSTTHPAGQKMPNAWGFYDMHGNVWEWCSDWYGGYPNGAATNPQGPSSGSNCVNRGGGWSGSAGNCRSADRDWYSPSNRHSGLGFRLALSLSRVETPGASK